MNDLVVTECRAQVGDLLLKVVDVNLQNVDYLQQEITDLGTAFRDYKIVHPEGTR